jgi:integrase
MITQSYLTLAHVRDALRTDPALTDVQKRDLISAISRVSTFLHRPPEDIPASVPHLRRMLADIHPAQVGITARALANVKSALARALHHTGHLLASGRRPRSAAWLAFFGAAKSKYQVVHLSRFADFCSMRRIEPDQVTDATLVQFGEYLDARLLGKDPNSLCAETAGTWNSIARQQPTPFNPLTWRRHARHRNRPLDSYPQGLQDDLQAYIDRLSHKDIFAEGGPIRPLRPMTLRNIRTLFGQYLSALAEAGADPETFTSLRRVISADQIRRAAQIINARRTDGVASQTIYNILAVVLAIARHHLQLPEDEIRKIKGFKARVAPTTVGMTAKNSLRLDQFTDFQNVIRLVGMPMTMMSLADDNPDRKTAPLHAMYAAAICILLACPMRIANLSSLDLDRHLFAKGTGQGLRYTIRVDASEVKNVNHVEVVLGARDSRLLHRYIMIYRHRIAESGSALFPRRWRSTVAKQHGAGPDERDLPAIRASDEPSSVPPFCGVPLPEGTAGRL